MTLFKLAVGNVKKSFRDYAIYFLTLTFGVCFFYIFNSIETQQVIMEVTKAQMGILALLNKILGVISWFISMILGFLIIYANNFLIKRRKKEFGIYMTLGMERGKISLILIVETALVGLFSLVAGIFLGVLVSQGLAIVTAKMLVVEIKNYQFIFSFSACLKTAMYFGIAFVLVMLFNTFTISKQKLIDLIYSDRKNEKFKTPRLWLSVVVFIFSMTCLLVAYKFILENRLYDMDYKLISSVILGAIGTFGVFFSLSGFFLKLVQQSKGLYLRNLNMFVLRQINSKINTTYVSMTFVCLMIFFSICVLSVGMSVSGTMREGLDGLTPFDATFRIGISKDIADASVATIERTPSVTDDTPVATDELPDDLLDMLDGKGVDLGAFSNEYLTVKEYDTRIPFEIEVEGADKISNINLPFIKLSDYNAVLEIQGEAPITLGSGEYAINSNIIRGNSYEAVLREYMSSGKAIEINGKTYNTSLDNLYGYTLNLYPVKSDRAVIVPDNALDNVPVRALVLHIKYIEDNESYEGLCKNTFSNIEQSLTVPSYFQTKSMVFDSIQALPVTVSYITIYIGIVFLIASAAVLAIAQLSEASDNATRYGLLRKIGTDDSMISHALFTQILVYFGVPLLLAVIHAAVGISAASVLTNFIPSLIVMFVILLIYICYFLATFFCGKSIIQSKNVL